MSEGPGWLIDKSALMRIPISPDSAKWYNRAERGLVHICTPTLLETGYSARSAGDWVTLMRQPPVSQLPVKNATPAMEWRAVEIQERLAALGHHRAPSAPDILVAATAEEYGLTVLHVDKDFELIAEVTGQQVERLRTG